MDRIPLISTKEVATAYIDAGVSKFRIRNLEKHFKLIPDRFKILGLCFPKVNIDGKEVVVPSFKIDNKEIPSIPVNLLFASHVGSTPTTTEIQKFNSQHKGKFMVFNKEKVNKFAQGLSEAEFVVFMMGKCFKTNPVQDYLVYSGYNEKDELTFHNSPKEAIKKGIKLKKYPTVEIV